MQIAPAADRLAQGKLAVIAVIAVIPGGMATQAGNSSAHGRRSEIGAGVSFGIATWPVSIGGACEGKK